MILGRLRVSHRILLVLTIGILTPAAVAVQSLFTMRRSMLEARAEEVKHLDEAAWTLVASYQQQATKGLLSESAAQEAAKTAIRSMRYDKTNYFFIWDLSGNGIAHGGNPKFEGRNFIHGSDAAKSPGVADMVAKLVKIAQVQKEGFARYRIPRAGQTTSIDKIGYSKLFAPWGWAVGTGAYVTDIEAMFWSKAQADLGMAAFLTALAGLLSYLLGRDLSVALGGLTTAVRTLASSNLQVDIPSSERGDEVGMMARAVQVFKKNAVRAAVQESELQQTSLRLEAALGNMLQGLTVHSSDGSLQMFNQQFCKVCGLRPDDVWSGLPLRDLLRVSFAAGNYPGRNFDDVVAEHQAFIGRRETGTTVTELENGRLVSIFACPMPNGGWVATYEDITDRRAADAKIAYIAQHDALTGLPNRTSLMERIEQALADAGRGRHSALLRLNLDDFKRVNDTFEHSVGDGLLVAVSERLMACIREGDTLARVGADEFVVVQAGIGGRKMQSCLLSGSLPLCRPLFG